MGTKKKVFRKSRWTNITDNGIRQWRHNKEQARMAEIEKKIGKSGHVYIFSLGLSNLFEIGSVCNLEKKLKARKIDYPSTVCIWSAWSPDMCALKKLVYEHFKTQRIGKDIFESVKHSQIVQVNELANRFR